MQPVAVRVLPFAKPLLWLGLMVYVSAMALPIFGDLEGRSWPVVSAFEIRSVERNPDTIILKGVMRKQRECRYLGMTIYAGSFGKPDMPRERLHVTFMDQSDDMSATRLPGMQFWGPWRIARPRRVTGPDLWIETRHHCHALWETQTLNLRTSAARLFGAVSASAVAPPADTPR